MTPLLYVAQRATAVVLAFAVVIHLVTIIYAVRTGLQAGDILSRTRGSLVFLAFYSLFVVAASIHAPIGLRSVMREWGGWRGRSLDISAALVGSLLLGLGLRAALAIYLP